VVPYVLAVATWSELREGLEASTLPPDVVAALLDEVPAWWLQRERTHVLVSDLSLCFPPPGEDEVRSIVWPSTDPAFCRLTLAGSAERPLLLAFAAVVASRGLLVERAAALLCRSGGVVVVRTTLQDLDRQRITEAEWDRVAEDVERAVATGRLPEASYTSPGRVAVEVRRGLGAESAVDVTAPHRPGLLYAICSWLDSAGCRIEAAQTESSGDARRSIFAVSGEVDADALAAALRTPASGLWPVRALSSLARRVPGPLGRR
jgi:hypothetical protein